MELAGADQNCDSMELLIVILAGNCCYITEYNTRVAPCQASEEAHLGSGKRGRLAHPTFSEVHRASHLKWWRTLHPQERTSGELPKPHEATHLSSVVATQNGPQKSASLCLLNNPHCAT